MCDTIAATGNATTDGVTLFGKNSDREPNEAQYICHIPARHHPQGTEVRCTYLLIPQAARTNAVLLSRPFWMWGAEMGANEHGLTIGNEAVFTRVPYRKDNGLTGMDLLRLALERAETALEAVHIITDLIATHAQGGN
ncbi:MAG: C69 family dipeptidase [Desulfosarcina sp.]|nr:C69 family dipeptidase [Desulfobacterales bacterium]